MNRAMLAATLIAALGGCEQLRTASAAVDAACADFRRVEVQLAIGVTAAVLPTIANLRSYGDRFCREGPPPGDVTTPAQQASWLRDLTAKLVNAALR